MTAATSQDQTPSLGPKQQKVINIETLSLCLKLYRHKSFVREGDVFIFLQTFHHLLAHLFIIIFKLSIFLDG